MRSFPQNASTPHITWRLLLCVVLFKYMALTEYGAVASSDEYSLCDLGVEGYEYKTDPTGARICIAICSNPCENGGICNSPDRCSCEPGFEGDTCSEECKPGWYGSQCMNQCACRNGVCNHVTGECTCNPGYDGTTCLHPCEPGFYGAGCEDKCPEVCSSAVEIDVTSKVCDPVSGTCDCLKGKYGTTCSLKCRSEYDDPACENNICGCQNGGNCTEVENTCKCAPGFTGSLCEHECPEGRFGIECKQICPYCLHGSCDKVSGECQCEKGWDGFECSKTCPAGTFGNQCKEKCSCPFNLNCDPVQGFCLCEGNPENPKNCSIIYEECGKGFYGIYCRHTCGCETGYCDRTTGVCQTCNEKGKECKVAKPGDSSGSSTVLIMLVLLGAIIGVISAIAVLIVHRRMKHRRMNNRYKNTRDAARMMLTNDEVVFQRDPVTGITQAYWTLSRGVGNDPRANVTNPSCQQMCANQPNEFWDSDPMKLEGYPSLEKGTGQRVELPYMVPISSKNPFHPTIPNDYSTEAQLAAQASSSSPFNNPSYDNRESYESGCYESIPAENEYEEMNYAAIASANRRGNTGTLSNNDGYNLSDTYGRGAQGQNDEENTYRTSTFGPPSTRNDAADVYQDSSHRHSFYGNQANDSQSQYTP